MAYGKRLQDALTRAGKTRRQLAAVLEVSPQAVGMVITGAGGLDPKLSALNNEKAATFLGVSRYWLLTGNDDPVKQVQATAKVGLDELMELIPLDEHLLRAQVFSQASQLIVNAATELHNKQLLAAKNALEKQP